MGLSPFRLGLAALAAAAALALAACGGERHASPPMPAEKPSAAKRVLALVWPEDEGILAELDPLTLEPRRQLPIGQYGFPWAFSPDGARLAVATGDWGAALRLVDLEDMRIVGEVQISGSDIGVAGLAWPEPARLLALTYDSEGALQAAVVDPSALRVVERATYPPAGYAVGVARTRDGLALLLSPKTGIRASRLAVVDAYGKIRGALLSRVRSGSVPLEAGPLSRVRQPGLAVDPDGGRAYVVDAGGPAAEVDLATMQVTYHQLDEKASLLSRVIDWLDPAAEAKGMNGPVRRALWLGGGKIAVAGWDYDARVDEEGREEVSAKPAGLAVIDTEDWTVRMLDEDAGGDIAVVGARLVAYGASYRSDSDETVGFGLTVYGLDGERLFHLFGDEPVYGVEAAGAYAYVGVSYEPSIQVVDLHTGRVVGQARGQLPTLLDPAAPIR